jgi:hypothetical protein
MADGLFSHLDKLTAVRREIAQRRAVYPRLVQAGRMSQREADRQIAIMQDIANDYDSLANKERLL